MNRIKGFSRSPFGSALLGGVVALALGIAAVGSGLVDLDEGAGSTTTTVTAPPAIAEAGQPAALASRTVGDVYEEDGQGVVFIEAEQGDAGPSPTPFGPLPGGGGTATGSGFLIDDSGHILTNAHVVDGSSSVTVKFGDGDALEAEVLGADNSTDVAVLAVDPAELDADPLELGDSAAVSVGDPAIAIGNPYGLDRTVTSGIISALQRSISAPNGFTISDVLQTDAAINPGNSGGPLIGADGKVIGINSQIATGSGSSGSVGIGFAVPINTAKDVAEQIIDDGEVEHAYLGITGTDVDDRLADVLNLDAEQGALVQGVQPGSPAADAGLQAGDATVTLDGAEITAGGDVITAVDGEEIAGMEELIAAVNAKQPGETVILDVIRDGEQQEIDVKLGDRPAEAGG